MSATKKWWMDAGDPNFNYDQLNPGIRRVVRFLHVHLFESINSGDGRTHVCECDADYPFVTIRVAPSLMAQEADRLYKLLTDEGIEFTGTDEEGHGTSIEATYWPADGEDAWISLLGVDDEMLVSAKVDKLVDLIKKEEEI
jgi:hypothetical protein